MLPFYRCAQRYAAGDDEGAAGYLDVQGVPVGQGQVTVASSTNAASTYGVPTFGNDNSDNLAAASADVVYAVPTEDAGPDFAAPASVSRAHAARAGQGIGGDHDNDIYADEDSAAAAQGAVVYVCSSPSLCSMKGVFV